MGGFGIELRMKLLRESTYQQLIKPFQRHGWSAEIISENEDGEYIVVDATKKNVTYKIALLYSSAIDNRHYKKLDSFVDHIFINGTLYHIESYAYGVKTTILPIDEFFSVLITWNKKLFPENKHKTYVHQFSKIRYITEENPLDGIWARISQFSSVKLAEKLIKRRALEECAELDESTIKSKAEGVAFSLRNAADYFRNVPFESLNKRILCLYYGTLALAFAEMLASPTGPMDLDEVEEKTKYGHGLYTVTRSSAADGFSELKIGGLLSGFFPHWVSFLGHDVAHFPRAKAKSFSDLERISPEAIVTMRDLLATLPEIGDLFFEVYNEAPSWIIPVYSIELNSNTRTSSSLGSSYIQLIDHSGRLTEEKVATNKWPISEITTINNINENEKTFQARVDHKGYKFWHEVLPIHRSPFTQSGSLIFPIMGGIYEYRVIAMVVLYALSIIVRYMPSMWRRIEGGDWDHHLALIKTALNAYERILPEKFLESIIGERITAKQPGGLF